MLAVFFVIFGSIGVILNWPVIQEGIFSTLTTPWSGNPQLFELQQYSQGFSRPDGILVIALSLLILLSAFIRTRRIILNLRILLLVVSLAIIGAELFMVFRLNLPLYAYTGLLYASLFFCFALFSAIFRFGSMKSFNSTLMGKPLSESRVFSQTFSQVLDRVSGTLRIAIEAEDPISQDMKPGKRQEFDSGEIKIGRDTDWADLAIGEQWNLVSGRHGVIRVIGKSLIYEPLSGHYAFALNGKPYTVAREMPNAARLNLVSGAGPVVNVSFQFQKKPILHPGTMFKAGEIARDEFKRLKATFKALVVMVILGLPLLWVFSGIQKKVLGSYIDGMKSRNEQFVLELKEKVQQLERMNRESNKNQDEIKRLKSQIKNLEQMDRAVPDDIDGLQARPDRLGNRHNSGKISSERMRTAKIIDIKLSSQRISVYFPGMTFFSDKKVVFTSGFFVKPRPGKFMLVTERVKIRNQVNSRAVRTFFFIYPDSWGAFKRYYDYIQGGKRPVSAFLRDIENNVDRYKLMVIDGRQWKQAGREYGGNAAVESPVKDIPGYLIPYIPGMDSNISTRDQAVIFGFKSGKKWMVPVNVADHNQSVITVHSVFAAGYSGGMLIRVLADGRYSVVGVSHTGSGVDSGNLKFLTF